MEQFKIVVPEESIVEKKNFIVNQILPLGIRDIGNNRILVLFFAKEDLDQQCILLQTMFEIENRDRNYIKQNPLNLDNIRTNKERLSIYINATSNAKESDIYISDFNFTDIKNDVYFVARASRKTKDEKAAVLDLYFTKENFFKITLFFKRFALLDPMAEYNFVDKKLLSLDFVKLDSVKFDNSSTDMISRIVMNHYTCRCGDDKFKFTYISPKLSGRVFKHSCTVDAYNSLYGDDFIITDMILLLDKLYILYEIRSTITDKYVKSVILVMDESLYNETNLVDVYNNYKEEENNDGE